MGSLRRCVFALPLKRMQHLNQLLIRLSARPCAAPDANLRTGLRPRANLRVSWDLSLLLPIKIWATPPPTLQFSINGVW